tara:strand:+ start:2204 stop:2608 length:405 start_codon:yes stop_codon:yes gene_type:complete
MDTDKEIFDGKTFASLAKDIYFNSTRKSAQIDQLIKDLRTMVKDAGSATVIAPMIKDYIDVSVKNDDQLVKLSAVLQRFLSGSSSEGEGDTSGLTESEKEELLKSVKKEVEEISKSESLINNDVKKLEKNMEEK